jgi:glutamate synthase (ferredoxin)
VRNSGVTTVVEGVGDHGLEYMTGGRVVVLGPTGRNFAAGMSGGVAYVLDDADQLKGNVNLSMVALEKVETAAEQAELRGLIQRQADLTGSTRAAEVLAKWDALLPKFVKIMPKDYKRMLECIANAQAQGLTGDEAIMAAFEENARDTSRVGGN